MYVSILMFCQGASDPPQVAELAGLETDLPGQPGLHGLPACLPSLGLQALPALSDLPALPGLPALSLRERSVGSLGYIAVPSGALRGGLGRNLAAFRRSRCTF